MTMYGADADELEGFATEFERASEELGRLLLEGVGAVSLVGLSATLGTLWRGPRASEFSALWQSRHLLAVRQVRNLLDDAARDVRTNADQQRRASAGSGGDRPIGPRNPTAPIDVPHRAPADGSAQWGAPISKAEAKRIADEQIPASQRANYDFHGDPNDAAGDWYQCTVWAKARWGQMGYDGPAWRGDGGEVAANINALLGRPNAAEPTVGAIVSMPGHVAVVEEVERPTGGEIRFRISEMNYGGNGWRLAIAEEFRDDRWLTVSGGSYTFAPFPG